MKVLYPSEDPEFETMMDNWASAARSAGVTLTLSSAEFNTVTSDIEPCKAGTAACNWQVGTWGGWTMNQYPTGQGIFTTSTTGAPPPVGTQIDKMVNATEYSANKSAFSSYENYVAKELPTLFMPWEQGSNYVAAKNLQGFTADEDNPFGMLYPEDWSFSG